MSTKRSTSDKIASYLKRCKNPAPTGRIVQNLTKNGSLTSSNVRRTLFRMKDRNLVTNGAKTTFNKTTQSTWSLV